MKAVKGIKGTASYTLKVNKFFVLTKKKGEERYAQIIQRTLFVHVEGGLDFLPSNYRVFQMMRGGALLYSIKARKKLPQSIWSNPNGRVESWYKEAPEYTKDETLTEAGFKNWLFRHFGARAEAVFIDYTTAVPGTDTTGEVAVA